LASDTSGKYFFIGLDLGKTIFANTFQPTSSGYTIEILAKTGKNNGLGYYFSAGYTRFSQDTVYPNTNFNTEGYFGKAGIEISSAFPLFDNKEATFSAGGNLVAGTMRNFGNFLIPGDYYPDFTKKYDQSYFIYGFQLSAQVLVPVYKKLFAGAQFQASVLGNGKTRNSNSEVFYYSPGFGITGTGRFTSNLTFQMFYKLK
jgi:hypothetical protein